MADAEDEEMEVDPHDVLNDATDVDAEEDAVDQQPHIYRLYIGLIFATLQ